MRTLLKNLLVPACVFLFAASAWAQPTITSITATGGGAYGGVGSNSGAPWTIVGTGFSTTVKLTRFVDAGNNDILTSINCATTTTCTASAARPMRTPGGNLATLQVFALVNGLKSVGSVAFKYYGALVITSVTPNVGAYNVATGYTLAGGPFTSNGSGAPGTTSIYLAISIHDFASGCTTTISCSDTAPSLTYDCCVPQGAKTIDIRTPGGNASPYFIYGPTTETPATPTITGISASTGPQAGGNTVAITGTNFIPGTQVAVGGFGLSRGTHFSFNSTFTSSEAGSVNCSSSTTCTMVVPAGDIGPADIVVNTICGAGLSPCSGNARPSVSIPTTKSGLYARAGFKLAPISAGNLLVKENGGQATFTVALFGAPTAGVHVTLADTLGHVSVSPGTLDFTPANWAAPQSVTITGFNDAVTAVVNGSVQLTATSTDPNYNGVGGGQQFTRVDDDSKGFLVQQPSGLFTTRGGGTATFSVVLTQAPSSTVTVKVASNDPAAGTVTPGTLTFDTTAGATFWSTPHTVTITGQNDGFTSLGDRPYAIILTTSSGDSSYNDNNNLNDVQVTNIDAATPPSGLSLVRVGPASARVTWNTLASATYYKIKVSTTPGGAKTIIGVSGVPGQIVSGLTLAQQYYAVISSVNAGGESADSAEVPFIIPPPAPFAAYDGDAKTDMTYYTAGGSWKILHSVGGFLSGSTFSLGGAGYTPVPGDYDGDGQGDLAVYNTTTGAWNILKSSTSFVSALNINWGGAGYFPVPGDYDGDGKTDPAIYRLSTGVWSILTSSSNYTSTIVVNWGGAGYTPIPGQDFDGDYRADIALYQQSSGTWFVLKSTGNYLTTFTKSWGGVGYTLVPGDYDGDNKTDLGLYQRSTGAWAILLSGANYTTTIGKSWGGPGYLPVTGDFDGDGKFDLGVFQQATGNWYVLLSTTAYATTLSATGWGTAADRPLSTAIFVGGDDASRAADFEADGKADITVYNSTSGAWSTLTSSSNYLSALNKNYGGTGYAAVPGDYDGDGKADYGTYKSATGDWSILLSSTNFTTALNKNAGGSGWVPVPGDYDGDGKTDLVVYNTTTGQWYGLKSSANYTTTVNIGYGGTGYTAVVGDFDGDGKTDIGVYRVSTGDWSVLLAASNYTTSLSKSVGGAGYVPVQGDYDGDGKTDFVTYNTTTGLWYGLKSSTNYTTTVNVSWGGSGYAPMKGDYDGDGKTDLATYVVGTGNWYILLSSSNYTTTLSKPLGGVGYVGLPQYP